MTLTKKLPFSFITAIFAVAILLVINNFVAFLNYEHIALPVFVAASTAMTFVGAREFFDRNLALIKRLGCIFLLTLFSTVVMFAAYYFAATFLF